LTINSENETIIGIFEVKEKIDVADIIVSWIIFWVLTLIGLFLFAGTILAPMMEENRALVTKYQLVKKQIEAMQTVLDEIEDQQAALWVDPQYTERIARSQLNLRKVGEETVSIQPLQILPEENPKSAISSDNISIPPDFSSRWWFKPFLDTKKRQWFMILSAAFVATAIALAMAAKEKRLKALGI
jgi:hypothetical protein